MSHVSGVGGAFLFSRQADELAAWYAEQFGFTFERTPDGAHYHVFWAQDPDNPAGKLDTTFAIMKGKKDFPRWDGGDEPEEMYGDQPFMLNLRVRDMEAVLAHLSESGIAPLKREDESFGRFAWIRDPEGNRVELYQPIAPAE